MGKTIARKHALIGTMEFFNHVVQTAPNINNIAEATFISKWVKYMAYEKFTDLCVVFHHELSHIHDFSVYRVDGQICALKFCTMHKLKLFIKWMSTRMKDTIFELSAENLLALTYEDFNVFRQADMIKMMSKSSSPPTTPLTSYTPGSKTSKAFLPQFEDPTDEPVFESSATLLDQEKVDCSPSAPFQSSSSSAGRKQTRTRVHFLSHFHDNHPSPDSPGQDVDKSSHLSDSTGTTDRLDESSTLSAQDDHLLQVDSTSLSSQDTPSVLIEFLPESQSQLDNDNPSQTDFSVNTMTINCSYSIKRLMQHLTISAIRKVMIVKNCAKMTPSSLMPETLV